MWEDPFAHLWIILPLSSSNTIFLFPKIQNPFGADRQARRRPLLFFIFTLEGLQKDREPPSPLPFFSLSLFSLPLSCTPPLPSIPLVLARKHTDFHFPAWRPVLKRRKRKGFFPLRMRDSRKKNLGWLGGIICKLFWKNRQNCCVKDVKNAIDFS